jgi:hypothetical protein
MDRPRIRRLLRFAFSTLYGIVCLLLIVLWVRSYWTLDFVRVRPAGARQIYVLSGRGVIAFGINNDPYSPWWEYSSHAGEWIAPSPAIPSHGFSFFRFPLGFFASAPCWSFLLLISAIGALPWVKFGFSLRTLLIATTIVAVVLGLGVVFR